MGYTVSRSTARKILRLVNRSDNAPRSVGPRLRGGSGGSGDGAGHLLVRVRNISPDPVVPAQAWTLDGRSVAIGNIALPRVRVYATALAGSEGPYGVVGNGFCIAHRVRGAFATLREGE